MISELFYKKIVFCQIIGNDTTELGKLVSLYYGGSIGKELFFKAFFSSREEEPGCKIPGKLSKVIDLE